MPRPRSSTRHPDKPELSEETEARIEPFLTGALGPRAPAVLQTLERFEAAVPSGPPFYYVSFLGTHPDARGRASGWAYSTRSAPGRQRGRADISGVDQPG